MYLRGVAEIISEYISIYLQCEPNKGDKTSHQDFYSFVRKAVLFGSFM